MDDNFVLLVTSLLGGGALATIVTAFVTKKKTNAEANNTNIGTLLEASSRMDERIDTLEKRIKVLEDENTKLRMENIDLIAQNTQLRIELKQANQGGE